MALTDEDVPVTDVATAVEEAGLESLFFCEHNHVPASRVDLLEDPFQARSPRILDQFTALGAAAAVTSDLRLGTACCIVPQHDPMLLAKQVATVDHISGGRVLFGVGAGWIEEEMRNLGVRTAKRWDLMGDQIAAMKAIWTHEAAEFHGQFVDFDPIWMWPKPAQLPHPPVLVGGSGPQSLRITAVHGDGWLPIFDDTAELEDGLANLRRECDQLGRPAPPVSVCSWEVNEELLIACAGRDVVRFVVMAPTNDLSTLESFLSRLAMLRQRVG